MEADVILVSSERRIILDTKFYEEAFGGRWKVKKLHSNNLYQLLSYLRNRQANYPEGPHHEGILLYPVVNQTLSVEVCLDDFPIKARGIDLSQDWQIIHLDMLEVVGLKATAGQTPLAG